MKNDYEKIVRRIQKENIILDKRADSPFNYSYAEEEDVTTGEVRNRTIYEPMFPQYRQNRQAHCLAHELGHHYIHKGRSEKTKKIYSVVNHLPNMGIISDPFIIFEEYKAWSKAKIICNEEGIDTSLFYFSFREGINSYWSEYRSRIYSFIKTFLLSYVWCVIGVLFFYLTAIADIHFTSIFGEIQQAIVDKNANRTAIVGNLYYMAIGFITVKWFLESFIWKKIDMQLQINDEGKRRTISSGSRLK